MIHIAMLSPGAKLSEVVDQVNKNISPGEMDKKDFIIVLGVTNDVDSGPCGDPFFATLTNLANSTRNTNLVVVGVPYRRDKLHLNSIISQTNQRIRNTLGQFDHARFLSLDHVYRANFYKHPGLHFNFLGKKTIVRDLYSVIHNNGINDPREAPHFFQIPVILTGSSNSKKGDDSMLNNKTSKFFQNVANMDQPPFLG
jgi:hypothetical protein